MRPFSAISLLGALLLTGCGQTATDGKTMHCTDGPTVTFHFPDPETLMLTVNGSAHRLERQRTASGARYSGEGMDFWNKGNEVTFTLDGQRFTCSID